MLAAVLIMSLATPQAETRVLLSRVSWETFVALADSDQAGTRFTYDRGYLEITSPTPAHERYRKLIGRMLELVTLERNIPILSLGSTTLKHPLKDRGLEPDACYYLANESRVRGREELDLTVDPPPDLAIEVDISRSSLNKLAIYGDFGVPEVWLFNGEKLRVYQRQADGTYALQSRSPTFPFLPLDEIERFLDRRNETDETTWLRGFRDWVRTLA